MNDKNSSLIIKGNLFKALISLALPIMINNFINTLYNLGDAFWVSKIGDTQVAAVNFVWPVSFLTISFAMGISIAGTSIISQYTGAEKYLEANQTAEQLYIFAIIFGVIGSIFGVLFSYHIIELMGAKGNLFNESVAYLRILFLELPFLFLMNIFFSINQAQGDTLTPTILNVASAILNIILDPIFIFTFNMGIEGAALATVLSRVPFTIYAVYKLYKGSIFIKIHPFKIKLIKDRMKELIRIGIPSSLGSSGVAFGFIVLNAFVVKYGENALAALGIGNKINSLAFNPAIGIGAALATIVGQNLGAGNIHRVKKAYRFSVFLSLAFLIITGSILWLLSGNIISIFTNTIDIIEMGSFYLKVLVLTTWSIAFFNCTIGLFNGSGHTMITMILEAGRLWIFRVPMLIIFGSFTNLGTDSIWYSIGISNILAGILAIVFVSTNIWKKPKVKSISSLITN